MDSKYSKIHKNDNLRYGLSCGFKPSLNILHTRSVEQEITYKLHAH